VSQELIVSGLLESGHYRLPVQLAWLGRDGRVMHSNILGMVGDKPHAMARAT
jgi:hypothetical protein